MNRVSNPSLALITVLAFASLAAAPATQRPGKLAPDSAAAPQSAASQSPAAAPAPATPQTPATPHAPAPKPGRVNAIASPIGITVMVVPSVVQTYVAGLGWPQPNPVAWATIIHYSVAKSGPVSIKLYSITGQEVATLVDGYHAPGNYSVWWDGSGRQGRLAPGVYIYRMVTGSFSRARRMVLVR